MCHSVVNGFLCTFLKIYCGMKLMLHSSLNCGDFCVFLCLEIALNACFASQIRKEWCLIVYAFVLPFICLWYIYVGTAYMTFQKFAPTARHVCRIPDEPWMWGCCVKHVIHSECDSSVCFLFPSLSLERWGTDGTNNTFLWFLLNLLQYYLISIQAFKHLPSFLFLPSEPCS